jgi:hypothetical protein
MKVLFFYKFDWLRIRRAYLGKDKLRLLINYANCLISYISLSGVSICRSEGFSAIIKGLWNYYTLADKAIRNWLKNFKAQIKVKTLE